MANVGQRAGYQGLGPHLLWKRGFVKLLVFLPLGKRLKRGVEKPETKRPNLLFCRKLQAHGFVVE